MPNEALSPVKRLFQQGWICTPVEISCQDAVFRRIPRSVRLQSKNRIRRRIPRIRPHISAQGFFTVRININSSSVNVVTHIVIQE